VQKTEIIKKLELIASCHDFSVVTRFYLDLKKDPAYKTMS